MDKINIRKEAPRLFNDQQLDFGKFDGLIYDPKDPSSKINAEFRSYFFIMSDLDLTLSPTNYEEKVEGSVTKSAL